MRRGVDNSMEWREMWKQREIWYFIRRKSLNNGALSYFSINKKGLDDVYGFLKKFSSPLTSMIVLDVMIVVMNKTMCICPRHQ